MRVTFIGALCSLVIAPIAQAQTTVAHQDAAKPQGTRRSQGAAKPAQQFHPNNQDVTNSVNDVRHSTAFEFSLLTPDANRSWVVARITQGARSGVLEVRSFGIDGKTGKAVKLPGQDVLIREGTFEVLAVLTGSAQPGTYPFHWEIPHDFFQGMLPHPPPDKEENFHDTAIFHLPTDLKDRAQFQPIYALPSEWESFVAPGWAFYGANRELFQAINAERNLAQLQQLLNDTNPLLSLAACRTLIEAKLLDEASVRTALLRSAGLHQAALASLLLSKSAQIPAFVSREALTRVINEATHPEAIEGIATGALAAYRGGDFEVSDQGAQVLEAVEKKLPDFKTRSTATLYLSELLRSAQLWLWRQHQQQLRAITEAAVSRK